MCSDDTLFQKEHPAPFHLEKYNTLTSQEKIGAIAAHFQSIMEILGLNLENPSLRKTPERVAKMYVSELFSGLDPKNFPEITLFPKESTSSDSLIFTKTDFMSFCEHHFIPMMGTAYIAYIPKNELIGLSKISRIVRYFSSRPQVQERLTDQIFSSLQEIFQHNDVAVLLESTHLCVQARGIQERSAVTSTLRIAGAFQNSLPLERHFFSLIANTKNGKRE